MNVFGYTLDGERNKIVSDLLSLNNTNQIAINKQFEKYGESFEKLEKTFHTHENVVLDQLKSINKIITSLVSQINTINIYLEDSVDKTVIKRI